MCELLSKWGYNFTSDIKVTHLHLNLTRKDVISRPYIYNKDICL